MPPKPIPDAPPSGEDEDADEYQEYTHAEALEEDFHGKRGQRVGKHGVKIKQRLSGRKSGSLRKSGSTASSLSAHSHNLRSSKSNHSGKPKHFQNSTVDEMMEAHVSGQSLVPPRRSTDTSRPSEIDQHKLEMERLGQILDMFDMKGKFGAQKEADAAHDGDTTTQKAQPIVNYSRRLSSSMNSSAGAAHCTASSPLLPGSTRMSLPAFRSVHRLPSASDLEISNSPSHPSLPALVTPPRPVDTPRTDLTETPSAAGTPRTVAASPGASSLRLGHVGTAGPPEKSDSFMTAASTPPESVQGSLSRPASSGSFMPPPPPPPLPAPRRRSGTSTPVAVTPPAMQQSGSVESASAATRAPEADARPNNMFLILAGTSATDPAMITRQHAGTSSKPRRRKKAKDAKEAKPAEPPPPPAHADVPAAETSDVASAVPQFAGASSPQFVIADASAVGPVSAVVPADSVKAGSPIAAEARGEPPPPQPPAPTDMPDDDEEPGAVGWAPVRPRRRPQRPSRPSSVEPRQKDGPPGAAMRFAASGGGNERRTVTKPAGGERGFSRSLTETSRRRSRSYGSVHAPQVETGPAIAAGADAAGAYAAGVTASTPHVLAHACVASQTFPVAPAPPVQQPLLLPAAPQAVAAAPQVAAGASDMTGAPKRAAVSRRSAPWVGKGADTGGKPHTAAQGDRGPHTVIAAPTLRTPPLDAVDAASGRPGEPVADMASAQAAAAPPAPSSSPPVESARAAGAAPAALDALPDQPAVASPATSAAAQLAAFPPPLIASQASAQGAAVAAVRPAEDVLMPGHDRQSHPSQHDASSAHADVATITPVTPTTVATFATVAAPVIHIPRLTAMGSASSEAPTPLAFPAASASFFAGTAPIPTTTIPVTDPTLANSCIAPPTTMLVAMPGFGAPQPFMATNHLVAEGAPAAPVPAAVHTATLLAPPPSHTPFGSPMPTGPALPSGILPPPPSANGTVADAASVGRASATSSVRVPDGLVGDMSLDEGDIPASMSTGNGPPVAVAASVAEHMHWESFPGTSYAADVVAAAHAYESIDGVDDDALAATASFPRVPPQHGDHTEPVAGNSHRQNGTQSAGNSAATQAPEVPDHRTRDMQAVFCVPPVDTTLPLSTASSGAAATGNGVHSPAASPRGAVAAGPQRPSRHASPHTVGAVTSPSRWADVAAMHSPAPAAAARQSRPSRPAPGRGGRADIHGFQAAPPPHHHAAAAPPSLAVPIPASRPPPGASPHSVFAGTSSVPYAARPSPRPPAAPPCIAGAAQQVLRLPSASSSKASMGAALFSGTAGMESSGVSAFAGSSGGLASQASSSAGGAEPSPVGQYMHRGHNPFQTLHFGLQQPHLSPRNIVDASPFALSSPTRRATTAPSTAADSMHASSVDTLAGRSPITPPPHERPIEAALNSVRETMEAHRMQPFWVWTGELPLEWHVLAVDVILRVIEASMIAALNDSSAAASSDVLGGGGSLGGRGMSWSAGGGSSSVDSRGVNGAGGSHGVNGAAAVGPDADDMYRGNETLAAFTLHHCMHVSLVGYARLNPFKHRSSQGATVDCQDDRLPYPAGSGSAFDEFRTKALPFTRMDMTSAAAVSTLSGFSQLEADTGEPVNDGPGRSHGGQDDNLFQRLRAVCTTVLQEHVKRAAAADDPAAAEAGFQLVLERLERFIALDDAQDPLSLHRLAGGGGDLNNIVLVFDTPDDQMRPPVVAHFIIWLLGRLLELTRDLACTAVDAFAAATGPPPAGGGRRGGPPEASRPAWCDAQARCLQQVLLRWSRLSNMAASVSLQISKRLLRRERLERFGRRFRSDSIIWSTVLRSANIMFVMGWEGPGPQPLQRMGLLKHVPYALCDGARLTTEGVPSPAAGSSKEYPHLGPVARNMAHDTNELLMRIISGQLSAMTSGLRILKKAMERDHPEHEAGPRPTAEETEAALRRTVEQWQSLRRDSQTRQLATFVKNLDSFFDIMINIVHMRENFEKKRILQDVEYIKSESYIMLKRDLADTFKWFLAFLLHTARLYLMYFDREWVFDHASHQYKERSAGGGYHAFRRGVTEATIRALLQQLNNACYIIRSLRDTEKRCVVTDARRSGGADDSAAGQGDPTHAAARLPHVWDRLTLRLNDILTPRSPTSHPQAAPAPEPSTSVQSDRIQAALGLRHGSGRSGSAPAMPTLEELTHEIIEQRTLPADETYVAQARSTLGIICKHTVEPLIQDRAHQLPAPVAIKWINVHVDSRAQESGGGGLSSAQRWALLSAEVSTMKRLRDSLQGPVPVTAGYPAAPPAGVRLEEANVVIYLTVHASDLNLAAIRSLEDPEPTQLMQVTVNKRVGTVMEWLPNGSVKDLLGSITAATMTLRAAVDAVAWARSSRTPVPPMPPHLADVRLAEVFTMPCNVPALQEIGGAVWMRAVIPPERSCKALRRVPDSDVPPELDIFRSRYGTFKQQVPFPACKEPLEPGGKPPTADGGPPRAELVRAAVPVLLLSFKWTLQLMLQSAKGVALCHRIGIAHRDLEPWNLMFDRYGRIKIIDFGDSLDQMRHMHGSTGPLSHELYLAPEVRMWDHLEPAAPDGGLRRPAGDAEVLATDIWTLGVVFWQFLTLHLFGTLGAIPAAGERMDRLRDELMHYEGCSSHHVERQEALQQLRRVGISDEAALRELARVPPLPFDPCYVRPAVFADTIGGHVQHAEWHQQDGSGGYQRLRALIVAMLGVHHSMRPNALEVAETVNAILNDYREML